MGGPFYSRKEIKRYPSYQPPTPMYAKLEIMAKSLDQNIRSSLKDQGQARIPHSLVAMKSV